jgi:hypothetical protein
MREGISMEIVPTVALAALVWKFVDFLKYLFARDWNGVVTQIIAWAAGLGAVWLAAATRFGASISIGDMSLAGLNGSEKVFIGLLVTSIASSVYDFKKARDNSDSATVPPLIQRAP